MKIAGVVKGKQKMGKTICSKLVNIAMAFKNYFKRGRII